MEVNIDYYLKDGDHFLWDTLGVNYPGIGPLYLYLCQAATLFCQPDERGFLLGHPNIYELERQSKDPKCTTTQAIFTFAVAYPDPDTQRGKAEAIVSWLATQPHFRAHMQKTLDVLAIKGVKLEMKGYRGSYE
jgi:hypothetical protein